MQCNEALEKNHQKARVEPRSYAAQGIDRVPGVHLGPEATAIERREKKAQGQNYKPRTFKAKQNAAAAERNAVIDAAKKLIDAAEQVHHQGDQYRQGGGRLVLVPGINPLEPWF